MKAHSKKETENGAYKNYAAGRITGYNAEIDKKVSSGLLDEERANKMKEEISRKIDILIQMWSEAGEKRLKEKIAELFSTKEETAAKQDTGCAETKP